MTPRCGNPDMQRVLLENARESGVLTQEIMLHLESCLACQVAAERLRRMSEVWMADQVDELAIARAAARFHARTSPTPRPAWFEVVPFASAGVLAGCALLVATGAISMPWKSGRTDDATRKGRTEIATASPRPVVTPGVVTTGAPRVTPVFASTDEGAKKVRARSHIETRRGVASLVDGMRLTLARGETAKVTLDDGRASTIDGPCLVEFWSMPTEVGGWKIIREESAAANTATGDTTAPSGAALGPSDTAASPSGTAPSPTEPAAANREPSSLAAPSAAAEGVKGAAAATKENAKGATPPSDGREATPKSTANSATEGAGVRGEAVANGEREETKPGANLGSARAWARAAVALREDDFAAADSAFEELCRSSDPSTRDAARLARAQLWISHGREAAVRPILEQLAQSGATPLIRQRAAETLYR